MLLLLLPANTLTSADPGAGQPLGLRRSPGSARRGTPRSVSAVICRATVLDVAQAQVPGSGPAANAALTDPGQPRAEVSRMRTS
jgi:hypothetical protein